MRCPQSRAGIVASLLLLASALPAQGQIPEDQYLRFVPLKYPRIIRQTEASRRFHLYGNEADPSYRDEAPRDGVDDGRGRWLLQLAARFAPVMVRNSDQFPLDFRVFYERDSFPIFVERWDVARSQFSLVDSEKVDMARLRGAPCAAPGTSDNDDCRLLGLIERFGPERSPLEPEATAPAEQETFSVMHFDLPGFDEKTWKQEYGGANRRKYEPSARVFAHPFVAEVAPAPGEAAGYELVIQFWFFYPANDGPNNHEGDWEHINVIVSPRSLVERPLNADGLARILGAAMDGPDELVIRRIEYYLHHFVTPLDFASPNVYADRASWSREVATLADARTANRRVMERIRRRAYRDEEESAVNTRPVIWIGGDGVGIQSVLQMPGLKDTDGHASYPFRGNYKRIGVGDVAERVTADFDHVEYFADPGGDWERVEDYGNPDRIALTPDWERILEPVQTDAAVRRDWSWLVLPLRFGYPASPSPMAGFVAHADMGNVSVVGPAYNDGWNRIGDSAGYDLYELAETSWARPLGLTDSFFPRLGFLNAPILYFMIKPPLDLIWRTAALPVRAAFGGRQPTFLPASAPATRAVSLEAGPMVTDLNDNLVALFFTREQLPEIILRLAVGLVGTSGEASFVPKFGWAATPAYALTFHLSPRFSAESTLINYKARVGFDTISPDLPHPIETRGNFEQFDYHGSLRFNLKTGDFMPYVKYGTGITWYQLRDVTVGGNRLVIAPDSPRFRPTRGWRSLGFNETVLGGGVDWNRVKLGRVWLGLKGSYTWIHHDIGFEQAAAVETFPELARLVAGTKYSLWRQQAHILVTLGF